MDKFNKIYSFTGGLSALDTQQPLASHTPTHPANMAIVRPQQLIQQEQNMAQLSQSAARPQQIIQPDQHIPQSVARPTQVILRYFYLF